MRNLLKHFFLTGTVIFILLNGVGCGPDENCCEEPDKTFIVKNNSNHFVRMDAHYNFLIDGSTTKLLVRSEMSNGDSIMLMLGQNPFEWGDGVDYSAYKDDIAYSVTLLFDFTKKLTLYPESANSIFVENNYDKQDENFVYFITEDHYNKAQ